jgi:hypothetical protein
MSQISKFGNVSLTCPLLKRAYYLRNFFVDDSVMPILSAIFGGDTRGMATVYFFDENGREPIKVFEYKVYVKFMKNNRYV